jgi:3-deoxy-D-manno-octulosonate 8-phosphate phosphatase (KDO 8-P phosphatase)
MPDISTLYGPIAPELLNRFAQIKLLCCDVDGVLSDGRIYMGQSGEELKAFHTKDGYGMKALQKIGVTVAIITGRRSNMVTTRMAALGIEHVIQGCEDKQPAIESLQKTLQISAEQTASIGDDMPDAGMFAVSNVKICVQDGHPGLALQADYQTQINGGRGAVREVCDLILQANGQLDTIHGASI